MIDTPSFDLMKKQFALYSILDTFWVKWIHPGSVLIHIKDRSEFRKNPLRRLYFSLSHNKIVHRKNNCQLRQKWTISDKIFSFLFLAEEVNVFYEATLFTNFRLSITSARTLDAKNGDKSVNCFPKTGSETVYGYDCLARAQSWELMLKTGSSIFFFLTSYELWSMRFLI